MRHTRRTEKSPETGALGALALACYATALAAMFAFSYSALALALSVLGRDFAALLTPAGV